MFQFNILYSDMYIHIWNADDNVLFFHTYLSQHSVSQNCRKWHKNQSIFWIQKISVSTATKFEGFQSNIIQFIHFFRSLSSSLLTDTHIYPHCFWCIGEVHWFTLPTVLSQPSCIQSLQNRNAN